MNSTQTTTLSIFNTLGDLLAGCITRVQTDACAKLFAASTPPGGAAPTDTLTAAEAIALHPWNEPAKLFALLNDFYPAPHGQARAPRRSGHISCLLPAPGQSRWFTQEVELAGLGGIAIDSEGNAWAANNQMAGSRSNMFEGFGGTISELAPNGHPISPMTTGYTGGGGIFPAGVSPWRRQGVGHKHRKQDDFGLRQIWQAAVPTNGL